MDKIKSYAWIIILNYHMNVLKMFVCIILAAACIIEAVRTHRIYNLVLVPLALIIFINNAEVILNGLSDNAD